MGDSPEVLASVWFDRKILRPKLLSACLLISETNGAAFKKFVELRRKLELDITMADIFPYLRECADTITLRDYHNSLVGSIETYDSLSQLVSSNQDFLNPTHLGILCISFPDTSEFNISIPVDAQGVNLEDPTSIEY